MHAGIEAYLPILMIDHNVMRLHISMHDALAVTEVERLEKLEDVISHVQVVELGIECPKISVIDIFEDERGCFALHVPSQSPPQSVTRVDIIHTWASLTTSRRATMLGPPAKFCKILISRLIFFFLTGFRTLMTHFW
jgi:hypothetical protein